MVKKKDVSKKVKKISEVPFGSSNHALEWLKEHWQKKSTKSAQAFRLLEEALKNAEACYRGQREVGILDLVRNVLLQCDKTCLSKQISYHISAASDLPTIFVDPDKITISLKNIVEYIAENTPRGGKFEIKFDGYPLRGQPGIKGTFIIESSSLKHKTEAELLTSAFLSKENTKITSSRNIITKEGGQLWLEMPKQKHMQLNFVLPSKSSQKDDVVQEAYRYEVVFTNYPSVRKRFGKKKALYLLGEIERYIKTLVRYPFDMVVATPEKAMVTIIYETPSSAAKSVTSRVSQRLGSEKFQIGKHVVSINFRYNLLPLAQTK